MRLRRTVKETTSNVPAPDDVPFGGADMPHKAQKLLGAKMQVNVSNSRDSRREDFTELRKAEQKNLGTRFATQKAPQIPLPSLGSGLGSGLSDMPSWSTATAASRSSSDILPTPTASTGHLADASRNGSSTGVQPSQFYPNQQQSIESLGREYYDPSKQPLHVSQQTSASAVRDMALHKGSLKVHEMANDQVFSKNSTSASTWRHGDAQKKPKKLDLSSLFPRPSPSSARLLSPTKVSASPTAMTENTEFFPQETMRAELRRQGAHGRFETHKSPAMPPSESASTPRVKIFEPDIYDNTKTHSRKPPKGIKNWFDGFDISSDDEENEPVELPANPPRPSVQGMPSDFSPYGLTVPERTSSYSRIPARPMQGNLHPLEPAKTAMRRRMQSRGSESSTVTEDSSGAVAGHKRSGESRFTRLKLDSQSVLSLSSGSEEERDVLPPVRDSRYAMEDERETLGPNLPSPVPRFMNSSHGFGKNAGLRISESTTQTSGTIPIRLRDSTAAPMAVEDWAVPPETEDMGPQAPSTTGSGLGAREIKSRTTVRSGQDREGLKSAGGETSSSVLSDASRVMAVTEEEMMLLELMRTKRAAMQNNSFREGYRLALKQEHDYLSKRRQSAHNSVGKMLEERANKELQSPPPPEEAREKVRERAPKKVEIQEQLQQNRYSVFQRIPDVEKGYKIDRFLAMGAPQEDPPLSPNALSDEEQQDEPERYVAKMAQMERFLMMKPSLADAIYDGRPVSGTEIDTDTMTAATEDEDAPSPMARLAGMSHERLRVTSPPLDNHDDDDDVPARSDVGYDEHHKKVRAFLSSKQPSADPGLTALPHMDPNQQDDDSVRSSGMLSPHIPEDDSEPELRTPRPPFVESQQPIPQPTSKFQDRSRLAVTPNVAPTELPSTRTRPPSVSTGFTSPLSQSFSTSTPPDNALTEGSRSPAYPRSPYLASTARRINKLPTKIDTTAGKVKTVNRITSMSSMTSAGEDVLAAWAELGGGSDALAARRKGR